MTDVISLPVADTVRTLAPPAAVLDPAMADLLATAVAEAEARGRREGEVAGRTATLSALDSTVAAITAALQTVHAEVVAQREAACEASVELATAVAREVVAAVPPDAATVVLDRVRAAAASLDDDPLEVRLHPDDHALLADAPVDARLRLVADPALAPGDARVAGRWGRAELTRSALLEAALAQLTAEGER